MSRHRDVRCMNYSEEYEGYDDVYGHSVEDDYCVSPSAEQFLFDRSKQQNIASFITEPDIIEDNEDNEELPVSFNDENVTLTDIELGKLMSCMEPIKNVIGDTVPDSEIKKKIIQSNFDVKIALDLILKESSPKTATGSSMVNKDNLEPYPDAASVKPQSNSFIIPKLSFNKQENIEGTNENVCLMNNLESFKDLAISNSPMRFSSLSGFSNLVNSPLSSSTSFKNNSDSVAFKTLADLTAHHLRKNSSLIDNSNSSEKSLSPKTNFIIPKLSIKKDDCSDINNTQLDLPTAQKDIDGSILNDRKTDDSMDSFEQSLFSAFAFSKDYPNTIIESNSQSEKSQNDPVLNVSGTRTPSPDPWIIDLNSTLKKNTFLATNGDCHTKSEVLEDIHDVIPISTLQISNENIEIPYVMLPTKLNLSYLRYVKLPYTKKNVSLFGRTLCRTLKLKKPILKSQQEHHKTIKRFNFSVPYTRI